MAKLIANSIIKFTLRLSLLQLAIASSGAVVTVTGEDVQNERPPTEAYFRMINDYEDVHAAQKLQDRSDAFALSSDRRSVVECGGVYKRLQSEIRSPGFPADYQGHLHCEYTFKSPFVCSNQYHFQFLEFSLEPSRNCSKDRLVIGEEEVLCGTVIGSKLYDAPGGVLRVKFVTDGWGSGRGFRLLVTRQPCSEDNEAAESSTAYTVYTTIQVADETESSGEDSATERPESVSNDVKHVSSRQDIPPEFNPGGNGYLPPYNHQLQDVLQHLVNLSHSTRNILPITQDIQRFREVRKAPHHSELQLHLGTHQSGKRNHDLNSPNQRRNALQQASSPKIKFHSSLDSALRAAGTLSTSADSTSPDCVVQVQRHSPLTCRLVISFKFFLFGNDQYPGCAGGFVEIDGQRICGCRTGQVYRTADFGPYPSKPIRIYSRAGRFPTVQGFVLDVYQEECPQRFPLKRSDGTDRERMVERPVRNRPSFEMARAEGRQLAAAVPVHTVQTTNTTQQQITHHYYWYNLDEAEPIKRPQDVPNVAVQESQQQPAALHQRPVGLWPHSQKIVPLPPATPAAGPNRCLYSTLDWLRLKLDWLWIFKPSMSPRIPASRTVHSSPCLCLLISISSIEMTRGNACPVRDEDKIVHGTGIAPVVPSGPFATVRRELLRPHSTAITQRSILLAKAFLVVLGIVIVFQRGVAAIGCVISVDLCASHRARLAGRILDVDNRQRSLGQFRQQLHQQIRFDFDVLLLLDALQLLPDQIDAFHHAPGRLGVVVSLTIHTALSADIDCRKGTLECWQRSDTKRFRRPLIHVPTMMATGCR
uniref:CUB domain-containing protein n=1 Tax=Anopheles coluzzii TaxID=1518534 RepID=A0A8W7PDK8_ANOCL